MIFEHVLGDFLLSDFCTKRFSSYMEFSQEISSKRFSHTRFLSARFSPSVIREKIKNLVIPKKQNSYSVQQIELKDGMNNIIITQRILFFLIKVFFSIK